jgi:hypothetical protein
MRKYTLIFMEQKIAAPRLTPIAGPAGEVCFDAVDDDVAQAYVREHFMPQLQDCVRAELSSMAIVRDASGSSRLIDDSLANPHFQETYIRYDGRSKQLEVDFVSTTTGMLPSAYKRSKM